MHNASNSCQQPCRKIKHQASQARSRQIWVWNPGLPLLVLCSNLMLPQQLRCWVSTVSSFHQGVWVLSSFTESLPSWKSALQSHQGAEFHKRGSRPSGPFSSFFSLLSSANLHIITGMTLQLRADCVCLVISGLSGGWSAPCWNPSGLSIDD